MKTSTAKDSKYGVVWLIDLARAEPITGRGLVRAR
jgi:hypothetical protein